MPQLISQDAPLEDGQFDDALETTGAPESVPSTDPRGGHTFIDEADALAWSSHSDDADADEDQDAFDAEEDDLEAAAFHTLRAEDEDWEIAERDFTKQYNRLKQHVAVRTGAAQGVASSTNARAALASVPAVNRPRHVPQTTTSVTANAKDKTTDQLQALAKYSSRLRNIDMPYDLGAGVNRKGPSATANIKDKSDRATSEQVLDPRTRIILFKLIGRGLLFEVNGCVSTGKEANVYHALTPDRAHLALKIYKTSILVFKDRDRYVSGEYRFRRGYSRHNPRKMVRVWAEKEMRNLKRLRTAGIRCPDPVEVRENVLVMGFIGNKEGWASPRLKDAEIPASAFPALYVELLVMTRKIFVECRLVHADLSEYNVLYHVDATQPSSAPPPAPAGSHVDSGAAPQGPGARGHLYIIDVSQSVEHDHPHAFDFLRADLRNIEGFFSKRGVQCVGLRRAFEFVTHDDVASNGADENAEAVLRRWMEEPEPEGAGAGGADGGGEQAPGFSAAAHEDSVFMRSYIPRTLNEVYDPERDMGALSRGEGGKLIYRDTIGLVGPKEGRRTDEENGAERTANGRSKVKFADDVSGEEDEADDASEDTDEDSEEDGSDGDQGGFEERRPRGHRHEDKEAKKERKQAVKAEAREKRKHKIPKAEKKRKVKATARGG